MSFTDVSHASSAGVKSEGVSSSRVQILDFEDWENIFEGPEKFGVTVEGVAGGGGRVEG